MSNNARGRGYRTARARVLHNATHCENCGCEISDLLGPNHPQKATADHIDPLSRGGPSTVANLRPLCRTCNLKRGAKGVDWKPSPAVVGAEDW